MRFTVFVPALLFALVLNASAQSTAFTYQGRLADNGNPANGSYEIKFSVFDSLSNPGQIGSLTNLATPVSNGLFTVTLNFGPGVFTGSGRWLEVGVRTNGNTNAFIILSPRQQVTAAPYAVLAGNLSGVVANNGLAGTYSGAVIFSNSANVFTGNGAGLTGITATVSGPAGGGLSGSYPNPVVASNAVTSAQITNFAVTTAKLADSAVTSVKIANGAVGVNQLDADLVGSVNRIVRGVINFGGSNFQVTTNFTPAIDPTKSYVILSPAVLGIPDGGQAYAGRAGAALVSLSATNLTVAVDAISSPMQSQRVSYQIVELK